MLHAWARSLRRPDVSGAARSAKDVLEELRRSPAQKVKVAVTDIDGVLRGKYLHKDKFLSAAEGGGFGFCNVVFGWDSADVCYDNATVHRVAHRVPGRGGADRPLHRAHRALGRRRPVLPRRLRGRQGAPLPVCPRQLLKKIVARAQAAGFTPKAGLEFEWFNFEETPAVPAARRAFVSPSPDDARACSGTRSCASANHRPFFTALHGRAGRLRHAHRGPAHRDGPRRAGSGHPGRGRAGGGGPRRALQDQREGDRPALLDHADLHGQVEHGPARLQRPHAPEPLDEARATPSTTTAIRTG